MYTIKYVNLGEKNLASIFNKIPFLFQTGIDILQINSFNDVIKLNKYILNKLNVKLIIKGKENIYNGKKVIISNHTSTLDGCIIFEIFKCNFLGSKIIDRWSVIRRIKQFLPILTIKRGKDKNSVKKIKKFINKNGSLCIFPEGMIHHPNTLMKFRSGAFKVGFPVQPVLIKLNPYIYDNLTLNNYIKYFTSKIPIIVTVTIFPITYPSFDENKIELIRFAMAKDHNLALSRVSNRDIVDKKKEQKFDISLY